jgi:hypothetical protein
LSETCNGSCPECCMEGVFEECCVWCGEEPGQWSDVQSEKRLFESYTEVEDLLQSILSQGGRVLGMVNGRFGQDDNTTLIYFQLPAPPTPDSPTIN